MVRRIMIAEQMSGREYQMKDEKWMETSNVPYRAKRAKQYYVNSTNLYIYARAEAVLIDREIEPRHVSPSPLPFPIFCPYNNILSMPITRPFLLKRILWPLFSKAPPCH